MIKKFKEDTSNIYELLALSAALNYQLRQAEEIRKKITKLKLSLRKRK